MRPQFICDSTGAIKLGISVTTKVNYWLKQKKKIHHQQGLRAKRRPWTYFHCHPSQFSHNKIFMVDRGPAMWCVWPLQKCHSRRRGLHFLTHLCCLWHSEATDGLKIFSSENMHWGLANASIWYGHSAEHQNPPTVSCDTTEAWQKDVIICARVQFFMIVCRSSGCWG